MSHWYKRTGEPCHYVETSGGKKRPADVRDARKLGLVPSVTTVIKDCVAAPGLEWWTTDKIMDHAIDEARINNYPHDVVKKIARRKHKSHMEDLAGRGDAIHKMIEDALNGTNVEDFIRPAYNRIIQEFGKDWLCEVSMAFDSGYGGKPDAFNTQWLLDIKSRDLTLDSEIDKIIYDGNIMQLAAYQRGMGEKHKVANVLIDRSDPSLILIKKWDEEEVERGWKMFHHIFEYWKYMKRYDPCQV